MSTAVASTQPIREEQGLLDAARRGDERAFGRLVERYGPELEAHCHRMLGSPHDAEDALQEILLRAWRGLPRFEGRSSSRSWLYAIATNVCLDVIARRPRRSVSIDQGPAASRPGDPDGRLLEWAWIEPHPDEALGIEDGHAAPEARYEQLEAVELAFAAALQHLPPRQRAVLILREVLGFSAREVSESLGTSVASVNSALQRARRAADERLPEQSQQPTLRSLGDDRIRGLAGAYVSAWANRDIDALRALLTADAVLAMPRRPSWWRGGEAIARRLRTAVEACADARTLPNRGTARPAIA